MFSVLKNELRRSLFNKWTLISFICVSVFCVLHFLDVYESRMMFFEACKELGLTEAMYVCESTPYDQWILFQQPNSYSYMLLFAMPLIAVFPYGASYHADAKSGYIKQIISRVSMKSYMRAKYIAAFISGGLVIVIPMIIQFFALATIYPLHKPYRFSMNIMGEKTFCVDLYYNHPMLFTLFKMLLVFVVAGLMAATALLVSKHISSYFSIIITPFVLAFMLIFATHITGMNVINFTSSLQAYSQSSYNYTILFVEIAVLFVCTYFGFVNSKKEVY